jgi:RNA polymerase sigma-70 factor (ECF subfamily)
MEMPLDEVMEKSGETIDIQSDGADSHDFLALHQALERLDERHRLPLVLFYFQELSYREIADTLELPLGTVMSRLSRARQMLHESLTRRVAQTVVKKIRKVTGI